MIRAFLTVLLFWATPAFAADLLTTDEVDRFVVVLTEINDLDKRYPEIDVELGLNQEAMSTPGSMLEALQRVINSEGEVTLTNAVLEAIQASPDAAREVEAAMDQNGFTDPAAFASVGNRLMLALARLEVPADELAQMQQISDMPAEMLPAPIREVVPFLEAFAKAVAAVPDEDIEQARRVKPQLDALNEDR